MMSPSVVRGGLGQRRRRRRGVLSLALAMAAALLLVLLLGLAFVSALPGAAGVVRALPALFAAFELPGACAGAGAAASVPTSSCGAAIARSMWWVGVGLGLGLAVAGSIAPGSLGCDPPRGRDSAPTQLPTPSGPPAPCSWQSWTARTTRWPQLAGLGLPVAIAAAAAPPSATADRRTTTALAAPTARRRRACRRPVRA